MKTAIDPIRRSASVRVPPDVAFEVFTARLDSWWPLETHSRAADQLGGRDVRAVAVEFQPRAGGSVLEHLSDGTTLPWADVLVWEPPSRFVLAWKPNASDRPATEVEVRFTPAGAGTLVELEHRGWERLGDMAREAWTGYAEGWTLPLEAFANAANGR